jgi:hypothetical protein
MKQSFPSKIFSSIVLTSTLLLAGCGGNDGKDDTTVIFVPEQQQREEGPVPTGPSVVVNNRIDNDVKVIQKNIRVVEKNLIIKYHVVNVDPVIHQQFIYVAVDCSGIHNDMNGDGMVDQAELEEAVGTPVATLSEGQGTEYETDQQLSVDELPPEQSRFALVVYGSNQSTSIPIICNAFTVNHANGHDHDHHTTTTTPGNDDGTSVSTTTTSTTVPLMSP